MKARPADACSPRELLVLIAIAGAPASLALAYYDQGLTEPQVYQRLLNNVEPPHESTAAEAFASSKPDGPVQ
jgi:hypothetical protein